MSLRLRVMAALLLTSLAALSLTFPGRAEARSAAAPPAVGRAFLGNVDEGGASYKVQLSTPNDRVAILYVSGGKLREIPFGQWTKYAVRPKTPLSSGVLRADFPGIGTVSLRFEPKGAPADGPSRGICGGKHGATERGVYRGRIDLEGEGGYFHLQAHRAPGKMVRPACAAAAPRQTALEPYVSPNLSSTGGVTARLETLTKSPGLLVGFQASRIRGEAFGELASAAVEAAGPMTVGRYAYEARPSAFSASAPPEGPPIATVDSTTTFNGNPSMPGTWSARIQTEFLGGVTHEVVGPGVRTRVCVFGMPTRCAGEAEPLLRGSPLEP